jgi:hypothetical protein
MARGISSIVTTAVVAGAIGFGAKGGVGGLYSPVFFSEIKWL